MTLDLRRRRRLSFDFPLNGTFPRASLFPSHFFSYITGIQVNEMFCVWVVLWRALVNGCCCGGETLTVADDGHGDEEEQEQATARRQRRPDQQLARLLRVAFLHPWWRTDRGKHNTHGFCYQYIAKEMDSFILVIVKLTETWTLQTSRAYTRCSGSCSSSSRAGGSHCGGLGFLGRNWVWKLFSIN